MTLFSDPRVGELLGEGLTRNLEGLFELMGYAEEEIAAAGGQEDDPVWRSFKLMNPSEMLLRTEIVYRAHCRELIERVKTGQDTRPGTDAEMMSQSAPLNRSAVGLQLRLFKRRLPEQFDLLGVDLAQYEGDAWEIDEYEATLRRKLTDRDRRLQEGG
jgi:hypothetical protein